MRLDHQMNANHSWNVRWLRSYSPQKNQIIPDGGRRARSRRRPRARRTTSTRRWSPRFNSAFGNTKFNTFRAVFTQEDVAFANPNFNTNGQHGDQLQPTLNFLTFADQQSAVMQARVNDAYQFDDTFSWFIPGKKGDHSLRMGVQYEHVDVFSTRAGQLERHVHVPHRPAFNASDPTTYPERLSIRVPGAGEYTQKEHFFSVFAQDKWKLSNRLTLSLGVRYDLEKIADAPGRQPGLLRSERLPAGQEQHLAAASASRTT